MLGLTATPFAATASRQSSLCCVTDSAYRGKSDGAPRDLEVIPHIMSGTIELAGDAGIQDVFRHLVTDVRRTGNIAAEIEQAFSQGRKVLVLTERTDHLEAIEAELASKVQNLSPMDACRGKSRGTDAA